MALGPSTIRFRRGWSNQGSNTSGRKLLDARPSYRIVVLGIAVTVGITDKEDGLLSIYFGTDPLAQDKIILPARMQGASEAGDNIGFSAGPLVVSFPDFSVMGDVNDPVYLSWFPIRTGSTIQGTIWGYYQDVNPGST